MKPDQAFFLSGGEDHLPLYGITDKKQDRINNDLDRQLRYHGQQVNAAGHQQGAGQHLDHGQSEIAEGSTAFGDLALKYQPVVDQEIENRTRSSTAEDREENTNSRNCLPKTL